MTERFVPISLALPPYYNCDECGAQMAGEGQVLIALHYSFEACPFCRKKVDFWKKVVTLIEVNPIPSLMDSILDLVGFKGIRGDVFIRPVTKTEIDLEVLGLPKDASILYVNYTRQSGVSNCEVFPTELHGNQPERVTIPHKLYVYGVVHELNTIKKPNGNYGVDLSSIDTTESARIHMFVVYAEGGASLTEEYLYQAVRYFRYNQLKETVMNLSIAAEIMVSEICRNYWAKRFDAKEIERLQKETTYFDKLKTYLKQAAEEVLMPELDKPIRRGLHNLLERRNQLMHTGSFKDVVERTDIVEMFAAVLFLRCYCFFITEKSKKLLAQE